jgi:rhomboid-related protein 1/2/3
VEFGNMSAGDMMDVEAALLEGSPTMSTISSDFTDQTYADAGSLDSPTITTPMFSSKVLKDEGLGTKLKLSRQIPKKPKFRIRLPYLMICISIIEVSRINVAYSHKFIMKT